MVMAVFLLLNGCEPRRERALKRASSRDSARDEIQIAIVWPKQALDGLVAGGELAAEQINAAGGVLGRRLHLVVADEEEGRRADPGSLAPMHYAPAAAARSISPTHQYRAAAPTRALAQKLVRNLDLVAVVGHRSREGAAMASAIYEYNQVLYLAPAVTNLLLTDRPFQFTFRTIANNAQIVQRLVAFAGRAGYRRFALLTARNLDAQEVSTLLLRQAPAVGLQIVHHRSFFPGIDDPNQRLAGLRHQQVDAVFVVGVYRDIEPLLVQSRPMGVTLPFILSTDLEADHTFRSATLPRGTFFYPSLFSVHRNRVITQQFVERFRDTFGTTPGIWAAQGYDAIYLLADVMTRSASTKPRILASYLRYAPWREGVAGGDTFTSDGQITGMPIGIKVVRNGKWMDVSESVN
jgi:branched-chain amino acid transport system substrate-binding protein